MEGHPLSVEAHKPPVEEMKPKPNQNEGTGQEQFLRL